MRYLLMIFVLLSGSLMAQESGYAALLSRAQAKDPTIDFVLLRDAYMKSPAYSSLDLVNSGALWKPVRESDPETAEKLAQEILQQNYLNLDAHHVMYWVAKEREDQNMLELHDYMLKGLIKAITQGHDGSSPEQAYTVMSVAEEYAFCRLAGWAVKGQALTGKDGKMFDKLTVEDRDGKSFPIYFDTSSFFGKF